MDRRIGAHHTGGVHAVQQIENSPLREHRPRFQLRPGNEDEGAFVRARMRQPQTPRGAREALDDDEVDVEGAGAVGHARIAPTPVGGLDGVGALEQRERLQYGVGRDDDVEEVVLTDDTDRLREVHG